MFGFEIGDEVDYFPDCPHGSIPGVVTGFCDSPHGPRVLVLLKGHEEPDELDPEELSAAREDPGQELIDRERARMQAGLRWCTTCHEWRPVEDATPRRWVESCGACLKPHRVA